MGDVRPMTPLASRTEAARKSLGFMTLAETAALADREVVVPDPGSVLVSPEVSLGSGVVLWPSTILQCRAGGVIEIGAGTFIYPGTRIVAQNGRVAIGPDAEIGEEGGFTIHADAGSIIAIGNGVRLLGGGSLTGSNTVGHGAQILGPIRCRACVLGDGGTYREPDPDRRGGVLKGSGVARNIEVPRGHVIQSFDIFADAPMRRQSFFH
jgi:hypothetical protein